MPASHTVVLPMPASPAITRPDGRTVADATKSDSVANFIERLRAAIGTSIMAAKGHAVRRYRDEG